MQLSLIDGLIVISLLVITLLIGVFTSKSAGKDQTSFFLGDRKMPWWLLGVSMVATTFSADTPNLVTDIVRKDGVSGNWVWWAFLLTGMLTVFVYAKLWRRTKVLTDLEFYELRYGGEQAKFLRIFRAAYLGVFFNVVIMATVMLAGIKISAILLGLSAIQTILIASIVTVVYSALGGFKGVILTDFVQFIIAMIGTFWACHYLINLPEVGGLSELVNHPAVIEKRNILPDFSDPELFIPLLILPIAVQWWATWYPGAEPGGGGYIAQRMLSAKDESHAIGATLFFNVAHYALRPWPWILIALASIIVFPEVSMIKTRFPDIEDSLLGHDLAYPAMLSYLPTGLLGLVLASLIAAFMSTISTHLNWGASYMVNDVYVRAIDKDASPKKQVLVARLSTVILMILASILSLFIESAKDGFNILLQIGAGTGAIFILRWFWWRINSWTEIAGMVISFVVAVGIKALALDMSDYKQLLLSVGVTTVGWLVVTFLTPPESDEKLISFYKSIKPHAMGWQPVIKKAIERGELEEENVGTSSLAFEIICMVVGCFMVYGFLFGAGFAIYGQTTFAVIAFAIGLLGSVFLYSNWNKLNFK